MYFFPGDDSFAQMKDMTSHLSAARHALLLFGYLRSWAFYTSDCFVFSKFYKMKLKFEREKKQSHGQLSRLYNADLKGPINGQQ